MTLKEQIENLIAENKSEFSSSDREFFNQFKAALTRGEIRAATRDENGVWQTNAWVKRGI